MKINKLMLLIYIVLYSVLGIISLLKKELITVDNFIAAGFCISFLLLTKKYKITSFTVFFAGLTFLPHILGNLGFYELASLNYHYDWIVHFITPVFSTLAIMTFLINNKLSKKVITAGFIALFVSVTFGALIEMSEYWGFRIIGFGEGYLGFGAGDDSSNYGPWENSSQDTSLNFLGSIIGIFLYLTKKLLPVRFIKEKSLPRKRR